MKASSLGLGFGSAWVIGRGRVEPGPGRLHADLAEEGGVAVKVEICQAHLALLRGGSDQQSIGAVRQGETEAERAIGAKVDGPSGDGDQGVGLGRAVQHEVGVYVEPEALAFRLFAPHRAGDRLDFDGGRERDGFRGQAGCTWNGSFEFAGDDLGDGFGVRPMRAELEGSQRLGEGASLGWSPIRADEPKRSLDEVGLGYSEGASRDLPAGCEMFEKAERGADADRLGFGEGTRFGWRGRAEDRFGRKHELGQRDFGRDGCELDALVFRGSVGRGGDRSRGGEGYPLMVGAVIAQFSMVARSRAAGMDEPVLGFWMDVSFGKRLSRGILGMDANDEVLVAGQTVVLALLGRCEVPMDIEPVGVAGSDGELTSPIGLRQFFARWSARRWSGSGAGFLPIMGRKRGGFVPFQEDGRNSMDGFSGRGRKASTPASLFCGISRFHGLSGALSS